MPPNVLLVVADDQRPDTVGPFDDGSVSTPHLDEIAANGCAVRPYTTVPVCTPARAELFSGANGFENGCRWFNEPIDDDQRVSTAWRVRHPPRARVRRLPGLYADGP